KDKGHKDKAHVKDKARRDKGVAKDKARRDKGKVVSGRGSRSDHRKGGNDAKGEGGSSWWPRTKEWELATSVVRGQVESLRRITAEGKSDSAGERFIATVAVGQLLKGRIGEGEGKLRLEGWVTGRFRQYHIPEVGEEVLVYLKKPRDGRHPLLVPS